MEKIEHLISGGSMGNIYGVLSLPDRKEPVPMIIMSHGFGSSHMANQDYADAFTEKGGFAVFNFDFCGGGMQSRSDGSMQEMTVLTEAKDLLTVICHFYGNPGYSAFYLWGESQGGFVSSYVAGMQPEMVSKLVLLYPAFVLQDDAKDRRQADGTFADFSPFGDAYISRKYNEDAVSFDVYDVMKKYGKPTLILHGDRDGVVPLSYSERALEVLNADLIVFPGAGHGFSGPDREMAVEEALVFLGKEKHSPCRGITPERVYSD